MGQAGAIAALADQDYLRSVQSRVARAREKIYAIAQFNGFGCIPSSTNFVAVDCGRDGAYARKILEGLATHGIFVRMPGVAPSTAASGSAWERMKILQPSKRPCRWQ